MKCPCIILLIIVHCFIRDELRKINIKRVKKSLLHIQQHINLHSTLLIYYILSSVNLCFYLTTFYLPSIYTFSTFLYLYLLTMSSKKTFDPNALSRPVTRSKTAHEREGQSGM